MESMVGIALSRGKTSSLKRDLTMRLTAAPGVEIVAVLFCYRVTIIL